MPPGRSVLAGERNLTPEVRQEQHDAACAEHFHHPLIKPGHKL